jgi:hypothetical protein
MCRTPDAPSVRNISTTWHATSLIASIRTWFENQKNYLLDVKCTKGSLASATIGFGPRNSLLIAKLFTSKKQKNIMQNMSKNKRQNTFFRSNVITNKQTYQDDY